MFGSYFPMQNMYGLLGQYGQPQYGGLLGGMNTQQLMQQYLQGLYQRQYQPPALNGPANTVRTQQGPGGLMYQAPTPAAAANPAQRTSLFGQSPLGPQYNPDGTWNFLSMYGSPG